MWTEVTQINAPRGRIGASLVAIGSKIFMFGGRDKMLCEFLSGFFVFDTTTDTWQALDVSTYVQPRTGLCAFSTATGVCFFGGYKGGCTGQGSDVSNQFVFLDVLGTSKHAPSIMRPGLSVLSAS